MKISSPEKAILAAAVLFLGFLGGWLYRGQLGRPVTVETQRLLTGGAAIERTAIPSPAAAGEKVDINRATAEELTAIPGIGEKLAQAIVTERELGGPYLYPEDLLRVRGIGEESVQGLLDYITVGE